MAEDANSRERRADEHFLTSRCSSLNYNEE